MKIAMPKGRLGDDIFDIFNQASETTIKFKERKLIFQDKKIYF